MLYYQLNFFSYSAVLRSRAKKVVVRVRVQRGR
jgi:hypothetical protein